MLITPKISYNSFINKGRQEQFPVNQAKTQLI